MEILEHIERKLNLMMSEGKQQLTDVRNKNVASNKLTLMIRQIIATLEDFMNLDGYRNLIDKIQSTVKPED